jgi:hypothetical protein
MAKAFFRGPGDKPFVAHFRLYHLDKGTVYQEKGGVTVSIDSDGFFGIAVCHPKEAFMRKLGFTLAEKRRKSRQNYISRDITRAATVRDLKDLAHVLAHAHTNQCNWRKNHGLEFRC